ncbi:MAG: 6-phosphogluconolactonase [Bacteroidales bacterium]
MSSNIVKKFPTVTHISQYIAKMITGGIASSGHGDYFSIALAGGSTPREVYSYLATIKDNPVDWQKVCLFWGDERCVAQESAESNYRMVKESLLDHIDIPDSNVVRIKGERDPSSEATRYAETVKFLLPHENNTPRFDLVLLGLGEDGHTVSVFPDNILLFHSDKLFEATKNPYNRQQRITATGKLINQAAVVVFIVTGRSKAGITASVIEKRGDWKKYPATLVQPVNGELIWLLDKEAASEFEREL